MSFSRWRETSQNINSNPSFVFTFVGDNATGKTGEFSNNVFNLKTLAQNRTLTVEGTRLDTRDRYPDNKSGFMIQLNGIKVSASEFAYSAKVVTLNRSLGDADEITFIL